MKKGMPLHPLNKILIDKNINKMDPGQLVTRTNGKNDHYLTKIFFLPLIYRPDLLILLTR